VLIINVEREKTTPVAREYGVFIEKKKKQVGGTFTKAIRLMGGRPKTPEKIFRTDVRGDKKGTRKLRKNKRSKRQKELLVPPKKKKHRNWCSGL